jgi:apolipoprotein N-acyltransferase
MFARGRSYFIRVAGIVLVEPVLWAGLELVRSNLFGGFAWNHLGVPMVLSGFGDIASLGGVYACSAAVVMINGTIASMAERMFANILPLEKEKKVIVVQGTELEIKVDEFCGKKAERLARSVPKYLRSIETVLPLFLVYAMFQASSFMSRASLSREAPFESLPVAVVQRNFPCVFSSSAECESPRDVYRTLLSNMSMLRPSLAVLPESAFCEAGAVDSGAAFRFAADIASFSSAQAVLAGGAREDCKGCLYNSAALYEVQSNKVSSVQIYDKVHLVPFGEYIPGDKIITALQKLAPVGSCTSGKLKTLSLGGVKLGVAICYEDTDSRQIRKLAAMGANVLVFITNDSWFSHSDETLQHYWQAVVRAIETGLPVVRVGNSGVSGFIFPDGRQSVIVGSDGRELVDARGTMFERVEPGVSSTVYVKFGDIPLAVLFSLLITVIIVIKYKKL